MTELVLPNTTASILATWTAGNQVPLTGQINEVWLELSGQCRSCIDQTVG